MRSHYALQREVAGQQYGTASQPRGTFAQQIAEHLARGEQFAVEGASGFATHHELCEA
jgi:hypothetical protein